MLYGLLLTFFIILCIFLILIILLQKSKGSLGMGSLGGSTQMLFGATGGQDLFQKITWICGGLFIIGSLVLALMKSHIRQTSRYISTTPKTVAQQTIPQQPMPVVPAPEPEVPQTPEAQ
ncbi:MAG: preprotein translocase subunit SecG [Candidatus Babeliaceae bacterium]